MPTPLMWFRHVFFKTYLVLSIGFYFNFHQIYFPILPSKALHLISIYFMKNYTVTGPNLSVLTLTQIDALDVKSVCQMYFLLLNKVMSSHNTLRRFLDFRCSLIIITYEKTEGLSLEDNACILETECILSSLSLGNILYST